MQCLWTSIIIPVRMKSAGTMAETINCFVFLSYHTCNYLLSEVLVARSKLTELKPRYVDASVTDSLILVRLPWLWTPEQPVTDLWRGVSGVFYLLRLWTLWKFGSKIRLFRPNWGRQDAKSIVSAAYCVWSPTKPKDSVYIWGNSGSSPEKE